MGGAGGAVALLETSQARFLLLVPWLLLFATALFAFGDPLRKYLDRSSRKDGANAPSSNGLFIGLLLVSFYTGYFGAGAGILVFTTLSLFEVRPLNESNAIKALCTTLANGVAVIVFIVAGAVSWPHCIVKAGLAAVGGYGGAAYSRRISARALWIIVISMGIAVSTYLFLQHGNGTS
ncbi:MAG: sulfite exporter TauE/SafE family protein [Acidobacteriaceae bacterium]|nr:sulfite exporter TauE/SafE family protein [Acidobacteriaceae bacterium]